MAHLKLRIFFKLIQIGISCLTHVTHSVYGDQWSDPEAGNPISTIYTAEDHGGGSVSNRIAEDKNGNIYIANETGILKFNGEEWSTLPATGYANFTMALAIDDEGRIWTTGIGYIGYFEAHETEGLIFVDMTPELTNHFVTEELSTFWQIYVDNKSVFLIADTHVLRRSNEKWESWEFNESRQILPSWLGGELYIHAPGSGLFKFKGNDFMKIADTDERVTSGIISVLSKSEDTLFLLTVSNGFFYLRDNDYSSAPTQLDAILKSSQINDAIRLRNGQFGLNSSELGTLIIQPDGQVIANSKDYNAIGNYIYESRSGEIWATTTESILRINTLPISRYSVACKDILRIENNIYLTDEVGVYVLPDRSETRETEHIMKIHSASGIGDMKALDGDVLIAAENSLVRLRHKELITQHKTTRHMMGIFKNEDDPDVIYTIGSKVLSRWERSDDAFQQVASLNDFTCNNIDIVVLRDDTILALGADRQINKMLWSSPTTADYTPVRGEDGQSLQFTWFQSLRLDGDLFFLTNKGLYRYDSDKNLLRYDPVLGDNLGNELFGQVHCASAEKNGWILALNTTRRSNRSIGKLHIDEGRHLTWTPLNLPKIHLAGQIESLLHEYRDGQELLWVGGTEDLLRYDLSHLGQIPRMKVELSSITQQSNNVIHFNGTGAAPGDIKLDYPQKTLRIIFSAPPTLISVSNYQSRLVGFEEEWQNTQNLAFRDFTNLHHGSYTFQLRAVDELNRIGPTLLFNFTILRPWYDTIYAYVLYGLAAIVVFILLARWWNLRLHKRNRLLKKLINERTYQLERQNLELIQATNVKQDFLANISHEIRNPLNGILGIARLLHENEVHNPQDQKRIKYLNSCAIQLHQLLSKMLDYSKLEASKLDPKPQPFNVETIVNDVIELHRHVAKQKQIEIKVKLPKITHQWIGDPILLRQILINLISNSINYTPNGWVAIRLDYSESDGMINAIFTVEDNGPGIPSDKQKLIFQGFTRLSTATDNQAPGAGLGLTIAEQLAQLMNGKLSLDTEYRGGARFRFEICFKKADPIPMRNRSKSLPEYKILANKRVLIADDMDINRYLNNQLLSKMGAKVDEASDGVEALHMLTQQQYDIAILDINMPRLNGLQVVTAYLASKPAKKAILIALSARVTPEIEADCTKQGFDHFLDKPLDHLKLESIFKSLKEIKSNKRESDESLLRYLANNDPEAEEKLKKRYQKSFQKELLELSLAIQSESEESMEASIHKLKGLSNIRKDIIINNLLDELSTLKNKVPKVQLLQICDQLSARLEAL